MHASGALTRPLLENTLLDEINLLILPVLVGQGMRLVPVSGPDKALDLDDSGAFPSARRSRPTDPQRAPALPQRRPPKEAAKMPLMGLPRLVNPREPTNASALARPPRRLSLRRRFNR